METVQSFNEELAGMYDLKPPISKGKMTAITKSAIRAIKYYKHVVQSVEKFIQKCKTEYKIPGLYVIDSIVRQSRHQFSIEKDVFAPRFAKNILVTFFHLFQCPQEDKSKVIRVLNLWQKNQVFGEDIIQPLFDLANPAHPIQKEIANRIAQKEKKDKSQPQQQLQQSSHHHHASQQQHTPQYQHSHTPQHPHTPQHSQTPQHHHQQQKQQQQQQLQQQHQQQQLQQQQQQLQQQQLIVAQQNSHLSSGAPPSSSSNTINSSVGLALSSAQVNSAAAVVSALDQTFIQQIQQMLMKSDDSKVASAVAALGLHGTSHHSIPVVSHSQHIQSATHGHSISSTPQTHSLPQVSHSIPTVQSIHTHSMTNASVPLPVQSQPPPIASVSEAQPIGVIGMNQSGDYDGRSLNFLPVDTSQPPPGYLHQAFPPVPVGQNTHGSLMGAPAGHSVPNSSQSVMHYEQQHIAEMQNVQQQSPREEGEHTDDSEDNKENQDDREIDQHRSRSRSYSRSRRNRRKSRSRSGSRTHHKRSRSRSRGRRSRSRDKDRDRDKDRRDRDRGGRNREREKMDLEKEREREKDREREKEKERDRKKKGLPPIKSNHLSVCSTTLWVGHLSRLVGQDELSDTFGEYGDIVSIDQIPPRGCAFICMNRRQDAVRALTKLRNHKMQGKAMTLAWAPGRGVKGKDFKDYWEVELGCSYVPFDKLKKMSHLDLDSLEEGGMIDEDTVPSWMKGRFQNSTVAPVVVTNMSQPPPSHLPQNIISLGVPPPPSGVSENLPAMPPMPPPVNKEVPHARHPLVPPHMMPPFGIPNMPPPGPGGMQMMPPSLPPLGVPPPIGMPPMPTMLGQPMLRVPPHANMSHPPPMVNHNNMQDNDNMDVEMEDVGKPESNQNNSQSSPSQERDSDGNQGSSNDSDNEFKTSDKNHEGQDNLVKDSKSSGMADLPFNVSHGGDFRNENYGAFNPSRFPLPRPPGFPPMGMMHGNPPNFGPRGLPNMSGYNAPRGLLGPPHMLGGHPPGLMPDMGGGHGIPGMVQMGLRPMVGHNGPMGNHMLGPMHHRGMPGGPGMMGRFPHGGFPRFGVPETSTMPPPLDHTGEREHGNWTDNSEGRNKLQSMAKSAEEKDSSTWGSDFNEIFSNNLDVLLQQEKKKDKGDEQKDKVNEDLQCKSGSSLDKASEDKDLKSASKLESSEALKKEEKVTDIKKSGSDRSRSWSRFQDDDQERSQSRDSDQDRSRERDHNMDRDRDRGRERDINRDYEYSSNYRNENDRYRDDSRGRDHSWGSQWGEERELRRDESSRWSDTRGERREEKTRWGDDRREEKTRWGDDRREEKTRWGDDRREDEPRWGDEREDIRSRWGENVRDEKPRWGVEGSGEKRQRDDDVEAGPEFDWNSWNTVPAVVPPPPKKEKKVITKSKPPVASKVLSNPGNSLVAIISSLATGKKQGNNSETPETNSTTTVSVKKPTPDNSRPSLLNPSYLSSANRNSSDNFKTSVSSSRPPVDKAKSFMDKTKTSSDRMRPSLDKPMQTRTSLTSSGSSNPNSLVAIISSLAGAQKQESNLDELNSSTPILNSKAILSTVDMKSKEKPASFMDRAMSDRHKIAIPKSPAAASVVAKSTPIVDTSDQQSDATKIKVASPHSLVDIDSSEEKEHTQIKSTGEVSESKIINSEPCPMNSEVSACSILLENKTKPSKSNAMAINPHFSTSDPVSDELTSNVSGLPVISATGNLDKVADSSNLLSNTSKSDQQSNDAKHADKHNKQDPVDDSIPDINQTAQENEGSHDTLMDNSVLKQASSSSELSLCDSAMKKVPLLPTHESASSLTEQTHEGISVDKNNETSSLPINSKIIERKEIQSSAQQSADIAIKQDSFEPYEQIENKTKDNIKMAELTSSSEQDENTSLLKVAKDCFENVESMIQEDPNFASEQEKFETSSSTPEIIKCSSKQIEEANTRSTKCKDFETVDKQKDIFLSPKSYSDKHSNETTETRALNADSFIEAVKDSDNEKISNSEKTMQTNADSKQEFKPVMNSEVCDESSLSGKDKIFSEHEPIDNCTLENSQNVLSNSIKTYDQSDTSECTDSTSNSGKAADVICDTDVLLNTSNVLDVAVSDLKSKAKDEAVPNSLVVDQPMLDESNLSKAEKS